MPLSARRVSNLTCIAQISRNARTLVTSFHRNHSEKRREKGCHRDSLHYLVQTWEVDQTSDVVIVFSSELVSTLP